MLKINVQTNSGVKGDDHHWMMYGSIIPVNKRIKIIDRLMNTN